MADAVASAPKDDDENKDAGGNLPTNTPDASNSNPMPTDTVDAPDAAADLNDGTAR